MFKINSNLVINTKMTLKIRHNKFIRIEVHYCLWITLWTKEAMMCPW